MFAKSEKEPDVGMANVPLQAKHTPALVTYYAKAGQEVKQFQPVFIDMATATATVATNFSGGQVPAPALAITAFPAKQGERVAVYLQGFFNVNALNLSAITALASASATEKANMLNSSGTSGIYFDDGVFTDPVQNV